MISAIRRARGLGDYPKVTAGRLLFMIVGVSVTSRAPAANSRDHVAVDLRIEVVDVGGDFDHLVAFDSCPFAPDHHSQDVRPIFHLGDRRRSLCVRSRIAALMRGARARESPRPSRRDHLERTVAKLERKAREQFCGGRRRYRMMPWCERAKPAPIGSAETRTCRRQADRAPMPRRRYR